MSTDTPKKNYSRRSFLQILGWGSLFATLMLSAGSFVRFLFPRVLFESPPLFRVGYPYEFQNSEWPGGNGRVHVFEKWKKDQSVWIVKDENSLYALHARCTHLGCTPNWFADEGAFKCPCHGSRFSSDGVNFAGPAPRPLDRFRIYIDDSGMICVDKSRTYTFKEFGKKGAYLKI